VNIFRNVLNLNLRYKFVERRAGDYPYVVADNSLAKKILCWSPKNNLIEICKDAWNFNKNKPLVNTHFFIFKEIYLRNYMNLVIRSFCVG